MDAALPVTSPTRVRVGKTFGIRATAYGIDLIIDILASIGMVFIVSLFIGVLLGIYTVVSGQSYSFAEESDPVSDNVIGVVTSIIYFTIFEWIYGATPGKLLLGMRVIQEDGRPCGLGAAFVRGLLRYIDGFIFGLVAYLNMSEPLNQRLGDKAANTIVVDSKDTSIQQPRGWWRFVLATGVYLLLNSLIAAIQIVSMVE